jgi:hypothetical protein
MKNQIREFGRVRSTIAAPRGDWKPVSAPTSAPVKTRSWREASWQVSCTHSGCASVSSVRGILQAKKTRTPEAIPLPGSTVGNSFLMRGITPRLRLHLQAIVGFSGHHPPTSSLLLARESRPSFLTTVLYLSLPNVRRVSILRRVCRRTLLR